MEGWEVVLTVLALMPLFVRRGMNRPVSVGIALALWILCFALADVSGWRIGFHGVVTLFPIWMVWRVSRPAADPAFAATS